LIRYYYLSRVDIVCNVGAIVDDLHLLTTLPWG